MPNVINGIQHPCIFSIHDVIMVLSGEGRSFCPVCQHRPEAGIPGVVQRSPFEGFSELSGSSPNSAVQRFAAAGPRPF